MWYVIQTETGKEETVKKLIEEIVPADLYEGCRIILYEKKRKYLGEWHTEYKKLFPGYLFLITDKIEPVFIALKRVPRLTKLIRNELEFPYIYPYEEEFLKRLCGDKEVVEMSVGLKVGTRIRIIKGCLMGLESRLVEVDRHKRRALISMEMMGDTRLIEVGLEVLG